MATPRNRLFTCLGCLVAGPLGCVAFLGGGAAVGTYFTPELAADFLNEALPEGFDHTFAGDLDIGSFELSWTRSQRIDDLVVRDPEGREVLRADVRAPSLLRLLDDESDLGVIEIELDVHLIADETGRTNLARAFGPLPGVKVNYEGPDDWTAATRELLFARKGELRISIRELALVSERTIVRGAPLRLTDVEASLVFGPDGPLHLVAVGATPGGALALEADIEREAFLAQHALDPGVRGRLSASGVPTELVAAVIGSVEELADLFGDHIDVAASLGAPEDGAAPLRAELRSPTARVELFGTLASTGLFSEAAPTRELRLDADLWDASLAERLGLAPEIAFTTEEPIRIRDLTWAGEAGAPSEAVRVELPPVAVLGRYELRGSSLALEPPADDGSWELRLESPLWEGADGRLSARLRSDQPFDLTDLDRWTDFDLALSASGVPTATLDEELDLGGELVALGETLDVKALLPSGPERKPVTLSVIAGRTRVELEGSLAGSPFDPEDLLEGLDFEASLERVPAALVLRFLPGGGDGRGWAFDWSGSSEPLRVGYEGWREREAASTVLASSAPPGPPGAESLRSRPPGGGSASVVIPHLSVTGGGMPELTLEDLSFSASGDADSLRVDLTAGFERGGTLQEIWTLYGLHGPFGIPGYDDAVLRANASDAPTAILDMVLGARGLLVDLFGPTMDLDFEGSGLSSEGGRLRLDAASSRATATVSGFHEGGDRVSSAELSLTCELLPRSFDRLVRPVLPLIAGARPARPKDTFTFRLEDAVLPLDGDPRGIAGTCRVDLGPAELVLLPELIAFLERGGISPGPAPAADELVLRLAEGRVHCSDLALPLGPGGSVLPLVGSYGFSGIQVDLQTELPLRAVGAEVNPILHGFRDLLQPDMRVPIVVSGDVGELDLAVRPQWLRTVTDVFSGMVPDVLKENLRKLLSEE